MKEFVHLYQSAGNSGNSQIWWWAPNFAEFPFVRAVIVILFDDIRAGINKFSKTLGTTSKF